MKWIIKYEAYDKDCHIVEIWAHDENSAILQLTNCKKVCWIKLKT